MIWLRRYRFNEPQYVNWGNYTFSFLVTLWPSCLPMCLDSLFSFFLIYLVALISYGMWDLVPWLGIKPGSPVLGAQSLNCLTTREVPLLLKKKKIFFLILNPLMDVIAEDKTWTSKEIDLIQLITIWRTPQMPRLELLGRWYYPTVLWGGVHQWGIHRRLFCSHEASQ